MEPGEYRRMFAAEDRQWWYVGQRAVAEAVLSSELPTGPLRILDAGCGTGGNLVALGRLGQAVGVDLAPEALAYCRRRGVSAARADLLALPLAEASFDVVTSFDVIYHGWVTDDRSAVREMARVLRPGGVLLLRVPALRLLWGAHDAVVHSRHRYSRGEVRSLLEACGLHVLRITYANTCLFPLLLVRRTLDRALRRCGSDVGLLPAPLEWLFLRALLAEAAWARRGGSLPIGASVVAVARKA